MSITYSSVFNDIPIGIRDILRADSTLLSLLGITSGSAKDHIFSERPVNQHKGFSNPRIVIEEAKHNPGRTGGNPEGLHDDTMLLQVSAWVDENPVSTSRGVVDRIRTLLDCTSFSLTNGGKGVYYVTQSSSVKDPDKEATKMGQVLVRAELTTQG